MTLYLLSYIRIFVWIYLDLSLPYMPVLTRAYASGYFRIKGRISKKK